ncbi:ATP-binding protein [Sphaerisporangium perillae]|uniref:ATP-binding protein n=1 Tax=Sphaerisporangium perillae TaxID=2935860 RepID=UPI002010728B|nr:ATP-binding protein [Sphaerisporangium perillae]
MTGYRTQLAKPAQLGDEKWEEWLTQLDRVLTSAGSWIAGGPDSGLLQLALRELRHDPYPARTARRFTITTLNGWGLTSLIDDAELVIGELVINALRHGLSSRTAVHSAHPVRIILAHTGESLVCVVTDPSEESPVPRDPDYGSEGGRGLQVVSGISHRWGWAPLGSPAPSGSPGKAVWAGFTLPRPPRHLEVCR